jgi:hypothetical protein
LRAPRANHVFYPDEKRIRTKNAVMNKAKSNWVWFFYKIADCVRTGASSAQALEPQLEISNGIRRGWRAAIAR